MPGVVDQVKCVFTGYSINTEKQEDAEIWTLDGVMLSIQDGCEEDSVVDIGRLSFS